MWVPDPREYASIASILSETAVWDAGQVTVERLGRPEPAASATVGVWRARGLVPRPWSAVCKVLSGTREAHPRWRSSDDPGHWYWWRREEMAYATGLLARLDGGLRAPRFLNVFARPGDQIALWIEDVEAPPAGEWSIERYALCARQLGRAQWTFARDLPVEAWLRHDFLLGYLERHAGDFGPGAPDTPLVRAAGELMADRRRLLAEAVRFPETLLHNDFHAFDLFGDLEGDSVAVDWAFTGLGPLPFDVGPFAADAVLDYGAPVDRIAELHEAVEGGFIAGLRDHGWRGDEDHLRRAMRLVAALKFAWIAPAVEQPDEARLAKWEAAYGRPAARVRDDWRALAEWLVRTGTAARREIS